MARFSNTTQSHMHSQWAMQFLIDHDDFLDSISTVADFGCGTGADILSWAELHDREDPPKPRNYTCYAVDINDQYWSIDDHERITFIKGDFERPLLSRKVDVLWCHDAFQYAVDPINTLRVFNKQMGTNGLLYLCIPMHTGTINNRWRTESRSFEYYNHTPLSLIYMLAISGFDTGNAYFYKGAGDPWLHAVVHKNDEDFLDAKTTSWHDLADRGLLHETAKMSLYNHGYPVLEEIFYPWLDHENHYFSA